MPIHFSREVFYFHFYILLFSHDTFAQPICLLNASVGTFMLFLDKLPQPAVGGIISRTHVHVHEVQTCNPLLKSLPYGAPYMCRVVLSAWSLLWSVNVNMSYCASANCHFYYLSECMGHCSGKWLLHDQSHKKRNAFMQRGFNRINLIRFFVSKFFLQHQELSNQALQTGRF